MTRREMLKTMLALGAQSLITLPWAEAEASLTTRRRLGNLSLYNVHTGESLNINYLNKRGGLDKQACHRLNQFFRCHYDGSVHPIDPTLFLVLDTVYCLLRTKGRPYNLISGYRSPSYNRLLCYEDASVAHRSYHIKGMAADIFIEGVAPSDIRRAARLLKVGGVARLSHKKFTCLSIASKAETESVNFSIAAWKFFVFVFRISAMERLRNLPIICD